MAAKVELIDTPFFPDDSFFCGPAALATTLSTAGIAIQPKDLVGEVFLPGRKGSLQIEMLVAARRHGAVATQIPGNLEALFREVAAGHPVLILQNLGLSWAPSWHYAVVVGYDLNEGYVILRSGSMKRQELGIRTFEYTWNRSKRWAVVTLRPGQLPVSATEIDVTKALLAFEHNGPSPMAVKAYRSGLARWPDNVTMAMGLGNALFAAGDYVASEKVFAQVAHKHGLVAAYNNQAHVLLKLKRYNAARKVIMQGLAMDDRLRPTLLKTLDEIAAASKRTSRAK